MNNCLLARSHKDRLDDIHEILVAQEFVAANEQRKLYTSVFLSFKSTAFNLISMGENKARCIMIVD